MKIYLLIAILVTSTAMAKQYPLTDSNGTPVTTRNGSLYAFIAEAKTIAAEIERQYGIPASATVAMACYESNFGRSYIAKNGYNFFGIKALRWNGDTVRNPTDGIRYRKYSSMRDGFRGYAAFLQQKRYSSAFRYKSNAKRFIDAILDLGYCPDAHYLAEISQLMRRHNL